MTQNRSTNLHTQDLSGAVSLEAAPKVTVKVGGEVVGDALQSETLGVVLRRWCMRKGIKTSSAYIDGKVADRSMTDDKLTGVAELDIIAKDGRGRN